MQFFGKSTGIYSILFGLIGVGMLVLLISMTDCRQETTLAACTVRWENYGLSVQLGEQLSVWLLGTSDIRLWPSRWAIPLAIKWSVGIIIFSTVGIFVTLSIAWLEQILEAFGKRTAL